jgi:hypothetical protein
VKADPDWDISARARATLYNLEKSPTQNTPKNAALKVEMAGWWKLNDGKDATIAADSSGANLHGKLIGNPVWVSGPKGGLQFVNDADYVELPSNPALDKLPENDFSMCAWFKADKDPAAESDHAHCGYAILMKGGNHTGMSYYTGGYLGMDLWLTGNVRMTATASGTYPSGTFYHLAGTVSRTAGETRIYINGELTGVKTWKQGSTIRSYTTPWRIGIAIPGHEWAWPTKGIIRDVRLYKGVLSDKQIEEIYNDTR